MSWKNLSCFHVSLPTDPSQTECISEPCVSTTENTPISEQVMGKDNNMDNSSSINDSNSLISKSLSNDQEVVADNTRMLDDGDALESDQKAAPQPDTNVITEEFLEPEESQNGKYSIITPQRC